jgi:hypothetical protein
MSTRVLIGHLHDPVTNVLVGHTGPACDDKNWNPCMRTDSELLNHLQSPRDNPNVLKTNTKSSFWVFNYELIRIFTQMEKFLGGNLAQMLTRNSIKSFFTTQNRWWTELQSGLTGLWNGWTRKPARVPRKVWRVPLFIFWGHVQIVL